MTTGFVGTEKEKKNVRNNRILLRYNRYNNKTSFPREGILLCGLGRHLLYCLHCTVDFIIPIGQKGKKNETNRCG